MILIMFLLVAMTFVYADLVAADIARRISFRFRLIPQTLENLTDFADLRTESYPQLREKC